MTPVRQWRVLMCDVFSAQIVDEVVAAVTGKNIGEHILGGAETNSSTVTPLSPELAAFAAQKSPIDGAPTKGKSVADYMREAVNNYALQLQEQRSEELQAVG